MKPLLAIAASGALALLAATSCLVDRRSDDFECASQADCDPLGRICDRGSCVAAECPEVCNAGCDAASLTCNVQCATPNECGSITCPVGFACTIQCTKINACGRIDCTEAASCDVQCTDSEACGDIDCGAGACQVTCADSAACDDIDCADSCACDVTCPEGACETTSCPVTDGPCTLDGTAATPCSSSAAACNTCP